MTLATIRDFERNGTRPSRTLVLAFLADEEEGGLLGAKWLIDHYPDLFSNCTEAIGEVGGFSFEPRGGRRHYLIETGERGLAWMRLTARGSAGHAGMVSHDDALSRLISALNRMVEYQFPLSLGDTVSSLMGSLSGLDGSSRDPEATAEQLGPIQKLIGGSLRNSLKPTVFQAGNKVNVVPSIAHAEVDGRVLPGHEDEFLEQLDELIGPGIEREWIVKSSPFETEFDGPLVGKMIAALRSEDPDAVVLPYLLAASTDSKWFTQQGIRCFGFVPLRLPPELEFAALFHGVDERVPVESLQFGVKVLSRFLLTS